MKLTFEAITFAELASAESFTSSDKARLIISGVFIEADGNTVTATATDSYRLVIITRELEQEHAKASALIPADSIAKAAKDALKTKDPVTLEADEVSGTFTISNSRDEWRYGGRLIEGKYPEVRSLIPPAGTIHEINGGVRFNPFFLAECTKVAPWSMAKGRDKATVSICISTLVDASRPARLESFDGRTVIALMPVR